jgi:exosortase
MHKAMNRTREGIPVPFLACMALAAGFMAFLAYDQAHWWRMKPDYAFGWLVPVFVAYVVVDRWPRLAAIIRSGGGTPLPKWLGIGTSLAAGFGLAAGVCVFLAGALYRAAAGSTQPGSLAMAMGFAGILLGMVYFNTPQGRVEDTAGTGILGSLRADARVRAAALFVFPSLIWMISAPLATAIESSVSLFLLRKVVAVVFGIFDTLGYSLVQEGNVLILPKGQVGVAEACSGIRSLTGCLFAGSFLSAVFLDRLWKKGLLIVAALVFAFLANLVRSLFLTSWAYAYGSASIEGTLHDATGFAVLGLTCVGLLALIPLFRPRASKVASPSGAPEGSAR